MIAVPEAIAVAVDQGRDGGNPCRAVGGDRRRMRSRDCVGDGQRKVRIEPSSLCQVIQRPALVETRHVDGIFDRSAAAVDLHRSVRLFCDGHDAMIDLWRQRPVDPDLLLAGRLAFLECRIVEKWKLDRPLDFQRARPVEEDRRCMRVDPLHAGMRRQCREDPFLGRGIVCHHCRPIADGGAKRSGPKTE